jgi:uncharacterized alkaline shock family protein YloU
MFGRDREEDKKPENSETHSNEPVEERTDEHTELGAVQVHHSVIANIARLVALKVPGVVEMGGSLADDIAGMLGKRSHDRGVRVEMTDNGLQIDIHVVLQYGARIPQVAWQIQNEIKQSVEQMTGKPVRKVNVLVQSLQFPEEAPKPAEGDIT